MGKLYPIGMRLRALDSWFLSSSSSRLIFFARLGGAIERFTRGSSGSYVPLSSRSIHVVDAPRIDFSAALRREFSSMPSSRRPWICGCAVAMAKYASSCSTDNMSLWFEDSLLLILVLDRLGCIRELMVNGGCWVTMS